MAIKMRRGNYSDLDTSKLVGGEIAVTDNPSRVVVKTNAGSVIKLVTEGSVASDAFANIKVGSSTIEAIGDDTLEMEAGNGVTLTPDTTNKKVTISAAISVEDSLTSSSTTDALSANQGKVLKGYVDGINEKIPSNASSSNKLVTQADVSSAYHAAGTKTVAELTSSLLVAANEGNVYNMTDAGTTTSDFIEGAGKPIRIGDNVGVCKVGNDYKFDLLSGFIDTSNFVEKSNTSGLLKNDGTVDTTTSVSTVSGKGLSTNDYTDADKTALQTTIPLEISQLQGSMLTKVNRSEIYSQPTFTVTGEALVYTPGSLPS